MTKNIFYTELKQNKRLTFLEICLKFLDLCFSKYFYYMLTWKQEINVEISSICSRIFSGRRKQIALIVYSLKEKSETNKIKSQCSILLCVCFSVPIGTVYPAKTIDVERKITYTPLFFFCVVVKSLSLKKWKKFLIEFLRTTKGVFELPLPPFQIEAQMEIWTTWDWAGD